jgi:protein gp37
MYRDGERYKYDAKQVTKTKTVFNLPLRIKEPSKIFTSSLTDFFHPDIDSYRGEAWEIIRKCPQHTFQILTKRPERIMDNLPTYWEEIRSRVWLGTSIGHSKGIQRLFDLIVPIQPGIKFLSLEPLHGEIDLHLNNFVDMSSKVGDLIDWVIIGGESGNESGKYRYRPCQLIWIENIIEQCRGFGNIRIFIKQMGTHLAKELKMSDRHGGNINEFPEHLRIREFPKINYNG